MSRYTLLQATYVSLILVLIICSVTCLPTDNVSTTSPSFPVAPTLVPLTTVRDTSASTTSEPNSNVIFQDDFTNPGSGWMVFSNDFGEGKYESGGYFLRCARSSYPEFKVYTTNPALTALTGFMIDMDVTMLSGGRDDRIGILLKWPDINPLDIAGYEQPSDYYFLLFPSDGSACCYSKHAIKGSSADLEPGYFLRRTNHTCVKGVNSVNNIKIWFNPGVFFTVNGYKLVNTTDENLDYANRLIRNGSMTGATMQVVANSEDPYSQPVFQLNRIAVYANN